jgi:hypothetical protein
MVSKMLAQQRIKEKREELRSVQRQQQLAYIPQTQTEIEEASNGVGPKVKGEAMAGYINGQINGIIQ